MIFKNGAINLSIIKNKKEFLIKLSNVLYSLSHSSVCEGSLGVGGLYHKNYYNYCCSGFFNGKNKVFNMKNALKSEFIYNIFNNLCNFGIYFFKEKGKVFIEIYSGNTFLIDENIQHFIEKFIAETKSLQIKQHRLILFKNYYLDFLRTLKIRNIKIICKNKRVKNYKKLFNFSNPQSDFKVKIYKDLSYKIFYKDKEISSYILTKYNHLNLTDYEIINLINLKQLKKVVNNFNLLYNKKVNFFDIFYTLHTISKKCKNLFYKGTYDKNSTELV